MSMLTREERAWVNKLQRVLRECPSSRIGFYTIGDASVTLWDRDKKPEIDVLFDEINKTIDFPQCVDQFDAYLGEICFPNNVDGVCG